MSNFFERYMRGEAKADDIDDFIELWHTEEDAAIEQPLHEYLGMTPQEYGCWLTEPRSLPEIMRRRIQTDNTNLLVIACCIGAFTIGVAVGFVLMWFEVQPGLTFQQWYQAGK